MAFSGRYVLSEVLAQVAFRTIPEPKIEKKKKNENKNLHTHVVKNLRSYTKISPRQMSKVGTFCAQLSERITFASTDLWRKLNTKYILEIQKRARVCSSQMDYLRHRHRIGLKQFHLHHTGDSSIIL